jgi:hypothetical protein
MIKSGRSMGQWQKIFCDTRTPTRLQWVSRGVAVLVLVLVLVVLPVNDLMKTLLSEHWLCRRGPMMVIGTLAVRVRWCRFATGSRGLIGMIQTWLACFLLYVVQVCNTRALIITISKSGKSRYCQVDVGRSSQTLPVQILPDKKELCL